MNVCAGPSRRWARALVLCLAVSISSIGCGPPEEFGTDYRLTWQRTGGLAGYEDWVEIDAAAELISWQPAPSRSVQTDTLTPDEIEALSTQLESMAFFELEESYECSECMDAIWYSALLDVDGADHQVTWTIPAEVPDTLTALTETITTMMETHFPD